VRAAVGSDFIIIYRLSMLDLVDGGSSFDEVVELAQAIEAAGATIINTGIGWHEARIPTIATSVPRGAFAWVTQKMKGKVKIAKVNVDENPGVAGKLGIRSIPTLMLFKDGKLASQKVGAAPKGELLKWINGAI